jgi:iron complex transport system substrate-binding protein
MRAAAAVPYRIFAALIAVLVLPAAAVPETAAGSALEIRYARGFQVEPHAGGTLVTVTAPWQDDRRRYRYLLVPRGQTQPPAAPEAQVVPVPVRRVVALSTTHLAYLDAAGLTDRLVGLSNFQHVNSPAVRQRIDSGALAEVGNFSHMRLELLLDLAPDIILTPASGSPYDVHPKLLEAGLAPVLVLDHLEAHPLGRCEWIKFLALLFDTREHAERLFREIEARYRRLAARAADPARRPTVITNTPYRGQWWVSGGNSYVARLIRDAGGDYLWSDLAGVGSHPMDVEAVFDRALKADIWINTGVWKSIDDALDADPRFGAVQALERRRLFNNNKRLNRWGGNDYWESGILRPDVVLADLIAILHPELLPDHELVYYRRLQPSEAP